MTDKIKKTTGSIAVVGASALFPGSAGSAPFWANILDGKDFMTDVPADHWLIEDYFDEDKSKLGKTYATRGAFLPKVDFDPMQYGMPPNQLPSTDTAQLLAIIMANKVLQDAHSVQFGKVDKKDISVILGIASATELVGQMAAKIQRPNWIKGLREAGIPESQVQKACDLIEATYPAWDESTFPGLLGNVVAGRVANRLDLGGTNCVIDAACASSLAAVAMAMQELEAGYSDLVITGGADALNDIFMYMCFSKTLALSPTGDCRPFSDQADGTMLGEGLGMVALRRLADAERDGDRIYGVIRGLGSSSDGKAKSIYAPRAEGQALAIRRAYERAGYGPENVDIVEAHGTATKAGDLAEFSGLRKAFADSTRKDKQYCALGSVKSQIGHTKAAAGSASLFKMVMALHHKVLPPTIKVDKPNPALQIEDSPFYLNTETRPWIKPPTTTRKAAVSSFGFGGSNFHLTLEEYVSDQPAQHRFHQTPAELLLFAGSSVAELERQVTVFISDLEKAQAVRGEATAQALAGFARASQLRFDAGQCRRLAFLGNNDDDAIAVAKQALQQIGKNPEQDFSFANKMHYGRGTEVPKTAFVFPGQGSQYVNMGADLAKEFDDARTVWDSCAAMQLDESLDLHQVVFPIPVFSDEQRQSQLQVLTETHWAQPAIGAVSASMLNLLHKLGIRADATAGHSYGEISALYSAGAITSLQDLISISRKRGELMTKAASTPGSMTAVMTNFEELNEKLETWKTGVCIANINSPKQVVIAGKTPQIDATEKLLQEAGLKFRRLPVATAFHSELVSPSAVPFNEYLSGITFNAPSIPVYANTTAAEYPNEPDAIRTMLAWQLANPVKFQEQIEAMYNKGIRLFLEVGPNAMLSGMIRDCLGDREFTTVAMDNRNQDGRASFWNALGVLAAQGLSMNFQALWAEFVNPVVYDVDKKRSKVTVAINGANFGKPYPPINGAAGIPPPNAELPARTEPDRQILERPAATQADVAAARNLQSQPKERPPANPITGIDVNWTSAFQTLQQLTLDAQKAFQKTLSDSHSAFLQASETAFKQLGQLGHLGQLVNASNQPVPGNPTLPESAPALAGARVAAYGALDSIAEAFGRAAGSVKTAAAGLTEAIAPAATKQAAPDPIKTAAPAPPTTPAAPVAATTDTQPADTDYEALLMAIVAEKTGYPVEMLELEMELEAGLGIDSIKRVEILSSLQDQLPHLADVDTAELATLNTLGEVLEFARSSAPSSDLSSSAASTNDTAVATATAVDAGAVDAGAVDAGAVDAGAVDAAAVDAAGVDAAGVDFEALLMAIVSEKTGYPVEMLELNMELEADLGIDSIKRVEILSSLQDQLPHLAEAEATELAALNTLGEVLQFASGENSANADSRRPAELQVDHSSAQEVGSKFERSLVQVVLAPSPGIAMQGIRDSSVLHIIRDNRGVAEILAAKFNQAHLNTELVDEAPEDCDAAIILCGLNDVATDGSDGYTSLNKLVFDQARRCAQNMSSKACLLVTVQNTGGDFGISGSGSDGAVWSTGIAALAKTAAKEWPATSVKAIDIATNDRSKESIAEAVFVELMAGGPEIEVGLMKDARITLQAVATTAVVEENSQPLQDGDVFVVSGGARGVTAACLQELAEHTRLKFAILGRTALTQEPDCVKDCSSDAQMKQALLASYQSRGKKVSPMELSGEVGRIMAAREVRDNIAELEMSGAVVNYLVVDVSDQRAVDKAMDEVRTSLGPIKGLIHAAGVLADKPIHEKTDDQFNRVFNTKVRGFQNLLHATKDDQLSHLACFSSIAARTGNPGQVDYAMANEILNRVCQQEAKARGSNCLVKSFGWGPWDGGMVKSALKAHFESMGVALIPIADGARFFAAEMTGSSHAVEIIYGSKLNADSSVQGNKSGYVDLWVHESTHAYIKSHTIRDKAVVPMMMANEWCMRVAASLATNLEAKIALGTRNLKVLKGILLENFEDCGDWLRIVFENSSTENEVDFVIEGADNIKHYEMTVRLGEQFADRPNNTDFDVDALPAWDWDAKDLYEERLFHGPEFRVISELTGISEHACAGTLQTKDPNGLSQVADQTHSDVPIMDGGVQLGLLWERYRSGGECLPTGFSSMELYQNKSYDGPVKCLLTFESATNLATEWGLKFVDQNNAVVAVVTGLMFHVLPVVPSG